MNITHHIERASRLFPNKIALLFEDEVYSYQELDRLVNRIANGLQGLGIKRGDRVALFLPNLPEFVTSYLGILKLGAVAVSLNPMLKSSEVAFILNDCSAKVLITTEELVEQVPEADLPQLKQLLITGGRASLEQLMAIASPQARAVEMDRHAPAAIVYTSGTTGFPKGATLSHGNVISNMYSQGRCCGMRLDDRLLLFVPLCHCFGQNAILNSGLNACATLILQRRFDPELVLKTITTQHITLFFGVPTVFIKLLNLNVSRDTLASVRYYFSAAASMSIEVARRWQEQYGQSIHQGYGLTETSPCASYNHDLHYQLGSIGTPIENVEMKLVNPDGLEVAIGELGEIVIRGPNVMLGYWNRPFETVQVIKNGWFHTGDLGRLDDKGFFYLVDRLKDMINVSGFKVYPTEVENAIAQHTAVAEVAVYGIPDPIKGELVQANIILKAGQKITQEQLATFCTQRMAAYKVPRAFNFVDSIPKNATGKVLRRLMREEALAPLALMTR